MIIPYYNHALKGPALRSTKLSVLLKLGKVSVHIYTATILTNKHNHFIMGWCDLDCDDPNQLKVREFLKHKHKLSSHFHYQIYMTFLQFFSFLFFNKCALTQAEFDDVLSSITLSFLCASTSNLCL